jgi:hypothetical protein
MRPANHRPDVSEPPVRPEPPPSRPDAGHDEVAPTPDDDAGASVSILCGDGECDLLDPVSCEPNAACIFALPESGDAGPEALCAAAGPGDDGAECTHHSDCGPGLDCTALGEPGTCRRYCCALNAAGGCPSGQFCRVALEGSDGGLSGVALCDRCDGCDTRDPDACGADNGCYLLPAPAPCAACLPAGDVPPGAACTRAADCVPGAACLARSNNERSCVALCDLDGAESECASGLSCREPEGASFPAGVGVCL